MPICEQVFFGQVKELLLLSVVHRTSIIYSVLCQFHISVDVCLSDGLLLVALFTWLARAVNQGQSATAVDPRSGAAGNIVSKRCEELLSIV
jgi:hypothetical protein